MRSMKHGWPALALLVALAAQAGEMVQYKSGEESVSGYLAKPEGAGPFPGLVVIHEWWGLNDWVKKQADRFAAQGYLVLAPDLYRGQVATDPDTAHQLMRGLPDDQARRDLLGAQAYLEAQPQILEGKVGAVGWCMGGGYALALARVSPSLAAAVVCYGRLSTDEAELASVQAPMLGIFGAEDKGIPVKTVEQFEALLKKAGKSIEIQVFDGVGHAFMNENNEKGYGESQAKAAWSRIDEFLARHLQPVR